MVLALLAMLAASTQAAEYRVSIDPDNPRRAVVEATMIPAESGVPDEGILAFNDEGNQGLLHGWSSFLESLEVLDLEGRPLELAYDVPSRWRVLGWDGEAVKVTYSLHLQHDRVPLAFGDNGAAYAREGVVMWSGRALFLAGRPERDIRVELAVDEGWRVATPWRETPTASRVYQVANTENLVNSGWMAGELAKETLTTGQATVHLALAGETVGAQRATLVSLAAEFMEMYDRTLGPAPRQQLLILGTDSAYWGGEVMGRTVSLSIHRDQVGVEGFPLPAMNVMSHLLAHEIFHLWGTAMIPADGGDDMQWFQEGFGAEYFALLAQLRGGRISGDQVLEVLTATLQAYESARVDGVSLSRAGSEKALHSALVYQGGMLAALIMDVELHTRTGGEFGLPRLVKHLYSKFSEARQGGSELTRDHLMAETKAVCGAEVASLLATLSESPDRLPVDATFARLGLSIQQTPDGQQVVRIAAPSPKQKSMWQAVLGDRRNGPS